MAYLLANAARVRMSREHDRHVWWFTKEEYLESLRTDKTTAKQEEYAWIMRSPDSINHKFDPNCTQCEAQRQHRDDMKRRDAEESERYRIRQEEEKAKKKEKEREADERRMMEAEDKPRTPPVKVKVNTEQNKEVLRLQQQKDMLMAQAQEIQIQLNQLGLPKNAIINTLAKCELCNVCMPSKAHRTRHLESTKHKINAGLMTKEVYPRHCDTCDYDAKTKHAWEQHCEGKKHQARSTQAITIPTTQEIEKNETNPQVPHTISPEDIVESS